MDASFIMANQVDFTGAIAYEWSLLPGHLWQSGFQHTGTYLEVRNNVIWTGLEMGRMDTRGMGPISEFLPFHLSNLVMLTTRNNAEGITYEGYVAGQWMATPIIDAQLEIASMQRQP
jgi:hypothetical protein